MTFAESVRYCLTNYATFQGRGSRTEFWWFALATTIAGIAASVIDIAINRDLIEPLVSLGLVVPTLSATCRRLHDADRSGWWQLLGLVPLIGTIILIVWLCGAGTPGPNRFGAAPA